MKTFVHDFSNGARCKIQCPDTKPPHYREGASLLQAEWSGNKPKKKHLPEYVAWSNGVSQQLTDEWGITIMRMVQVSKTDWQVWVTKPGGSPTMKETLSFR